ncbi:MAG: aminotransferase class III-fold pyridoxal phosphate-dependent enzyme [Rhodospirillales bacterium]|nr:aminotransferase class III-fold pyridoxal phosphate-dependent enzyme [Rhodospirillales bacterium]
MVSNLTAVLQDMDRQHHLHPFTDAKELNGKGVRVIERAEGVHMWTTEGHRVLDGMAGLWCVNIGYGRKELAEVAYKQMLELPYYNTFFHTTTQPTTELAAKLADVTPDGLNQVFFGNTGSDANDTICKLVRWYWNTRGEKTKKTIISRKNAYHGATMVAASLCGLSSMHPHYDLPLQGFVHADCPHWYRFGGDMDPEEFGIQAARSVENMILALGAENVGAFIGEPIMGAGGVLVPPESYWPEVQRICREHNVLLIADEVICGFGRTGTWFASEQFKIDPDFMTIAKGLSSGYQPISGLMVHDRVADVLEEMGGDSQTGFTYSGHPVAAAVALENINILQRERIVEHAGSDIGPYFQERLHALADHPLVGEVRGRGMMAAVEVVGDKATRQGFDTDKRAGYVVREEAWQRGLLVRATGDSMVMSPPLIMTRGDVDEMIDALTAALDAAEPKLRG